MRIYYKVLQDVEWVAKNDKCDLFLIHFPLVENVCLVGSFGIINLIYTVREKAQHVEKKRTL